MKSWRLYVVYTVVEVESVKELVTSLSDAKFVIVPSLPLFTSGSRVKGKPCLSWPSGSVLNLTASFDLDLVVYDPCWVHGDSNCGIIQAFTCF